MKYFSIVSSPIDDLLLVAEGEHLTGIYMKMDAGFSPEAKWSEDPEHPILRRARLQLYEYFAGERQLFDLPLRAMGTGFQREVWEQLTEIPYGVTWSYGELAKRVGNPNGSRAVGAANGQNPLPIVVPCHRVIGANGSLTGFGGGLPRKAALLAFERAVSFGEDVSNFWMETGVRQAVK